MNLQACEIVALVTNHGHPNQTEALCNSAILKYVAQAFKRAKLAPLHLEHLATISRALIYSPVTKGKKSLFFRVKRFFSSSLDVKEMVVEMFLRYILQNKIVATNHSVCSFLHEVLLTREEELYE